MGPLATGEAAAPPEESREVARRTYARSLAVAREVLADVRLGRAVRFRPVKRAVQSIIDQVLTNEASILGMTTLRGHDEYTFTHSVNVCIFSIALGKKLGLGKPQLYELGVAALLHDIGKLRMPLELLNKPGAFTPEERAQMQEHPVDGMLALFEMRGFGELPLRPMLAVYEHHMKLDQSGYPRSRRPRRPTLFSRIVAIADGFDAATSRRSYQQTPARPDAVLREMRENPARGADPLLVKAFIAVTGIYPVGSAVILDSYELAVVLARNPRPDALHQPVVRVLYDALGQPFDPAPTLDLAEPDPATGRPRRTIIKTTDPERYGLRVSDHVA